MFTGADRRHRIRNKLQYFYTIVVLAGVLSTAYFMMDTRAGVSRTSENLQLPASFRLDAGVADEALARLLQVEKELSSMRDSNGERPRQHNRRPNRKVNASSGSDSIR